MQGLEFKIKLKILSSWTWIKWKIFHKQALVLFFKLTLVGTWATLPPNWSGFVGFSLAVQFHRAVLHRSVRFRSALARHRDGLWRRLHLHLRLSVTCTIGSLCRTIRIRFTSSFDSDCTWACDRSVSVHGSGCGSSVHRQRCWVRDMVTPNTLLTCSLKHSCKAICGTFCSSFINIAVYCVQIQFAATTHLRKMKNRLI